jgi:hypothetical protein
VVAATLIGIGVMGIYESYFEKEEEGGGHAAEEQEAISLALAGVPGCKLNKAVHAVCCLGSGDQLPSLFARPQHHTSPPF